MKQSILSLVLLFPLLFASCSDEWNTPDDGPFSSETYFDFGADEVATCMVQYGESNIIFVQLGGGNYAFVTMDETGKITSKREINSAYPNFEAEALYMTQSGYALVVGALDDHPSWVFYKLDDTAAVFMPETWNNDAGRFFSAMEATDHVMLCGQKDVGGDRQVFLSKVSLTGSPIDSASFGTPMQDGGIHLLKSTTKNILLAYSYGKGLGDRDFWLMEIDENMVPSNEKVFGGSGYDQPEWILEAYGAYYLCGHTTSFGDPMHDAYLLCLEEDFSLRWEKNIAMNGHEGADHLIELGNNKLAFCSYGMMPVSGGYYGIIDRHGAVLDQKKFPEFERFFQMRAYPERLFILTRKKNFNLDFGVWVKSY